MKIANLTFVGFRLNHAIDKGLHKNISIDIIQRKINEWCLPEYLENKLGYNVFELLEPEDLKKILIYWQSIINAYTAGDLSVSNNGLCLLLALVLETIQSDPLLPLKFDS